MSDDKFRIPQPRYPARHPPRRHDHHHSSRRTLVYHDQWSSRRRYQSKPSSRGVIQALCISASDRDSYLLKCLNTKSEREKLIHDQEGIRITADLPFKNGELHLDVNDSEKKAVINLKVENTGREPVCFSDCIQLYRLKCFTLTGTDTNPLPLQPGDSHDIQVRFHCSSTGTYTTALAFEFKPGLQPAFYIVRFIKAQCMTPLGQELAPIAPYKRRSYTAKRKDDLTIVDGKPPKRLPEMKTKVPLKKYPMRPDIDQLIKALMQSTFFSDTR